MSYASPTGPDPFPYTIRTAGNTPGIGEPLNMDIYTPVSPRRVDGQRTLCILLYGQSNIANFVNTGYSPVQALSHMINPINGGIYRTKEPIVGCNGGRYGYAPTANGSGSTTSRLGDKIIATGLIDRVVMCNVAAGGTSSTQWAKGGDCNVRLVTGIRRMQAMGLAPDIIIRDQGENDTAFAFPSSLVTSNILSEVDTIRDQNCGARVLVNMVAYTSQASVGTIPYNNVRQGQINARSAFLGIYAGADSDTLQGATYRQGDDLHFNATGANALMDLVTSNVMANLS